MRELKPSTSTQNKTFIEKFLSLIVEAFGLSQQSEANVKQIQNEVLPLIDELCKSIQAIHRFEQQLKSRLDSELYNAVEEMIEPVVKELTQLKQSNPLTAFSVAQPELWKEKACLWIDMAKESVKEEKLLTTLIDHTVQIVNQRINQDLVNLHNKLNSEIDQLDLTDKEMETVKSIIFQQITPFVNRLEQLKPRLYEKPLADGKNEW